MVLSGCFHQHIKIALVRGVANHPKFFEFLFGKGLGNFMSDLALVLNLVHIYKCTLVLDNCQEGVYF